MNAGAAAAIDIRLLGKPALFVGERAQPFGGPRKAIALLAYLLLHRDRMLLRAAVAEEFWPDLDDEDARAALRRHLHRAFAALPDPPEQRPWIVGDKVTLRLNPDIPLRVDVFEYQRLCASGDRDAACALYRGDFLDGFYEEWALAERERFRELHAANVAVLLEERRSELDYPGAIGYAQMLLRLDPLREDAVRRIMQLRFASGDRSGAMVEFDAFSRRLRDELSVDPMPETVALHESIRRNDLGQDGDAVAARPPSAGRVGFPFVGREAVFAKLCRAWDSAARGAGSTVVVSGEAGIGKSRLIAELVARAEAQGGRVAFGTTTPIEAEPYQPVVEALRGVLPIVRCDRLDPVKLAAIATLIPDLRDALPDLPFLQPLDPERERPRLFDALESALAQLAEKRPLLVVFEDVHWASSATVAAIEFLARRLRDASALVVVSYREEDVDAAHALRAFVRRISAQPDVHLALGPLDVDAVRALVAKVAPESSAEFGVELHAGSEGNPLFMVELLGERLSGTSAIPAGIVQTVRARVARLSESARSLMETAAVTGTGFDAEVLRQTCGWSFAEVFDGLDELVDRSVVRESPQRRGQFAFTHQLVHAAIYETLDDGTRRTLHRRVGKTLAGLYPGRPGPSAAIARHFDRAGESGEAVRFYLAAVRYASSVFAHAEAIELASRALALASDPRDAYELHRLREVAADRTGAVAMRGDDCEAMCALAEALDDDDLLGAALCKSITFAWNVRDAATEAAAVARLRALGERVTSTRWMVEATLAEVRTALNRERAGLADRALDGIEHLVPSLERDLAFEYWFLRAFTTAKYDAAKASHVLEVARPFAGDDPLLQVRLLRVACSIADNAGDYEALATHASRALEIYREFGDLEGQANAHQNIATTAWYRVDVTGEREHVAHALALFERVQKRASIASMLVNRAVLAQHTGAFDAAEADYLEAEAVAEAAGMSGIACLARADRASLALARGDYERARTLGHEALDLAREGDIVLVIGSALEYLGVAERELGMLEEARAHLEESRDVRRVSDPRAMLESLLELIPLYLALGRTDAARATADELLAGIDADRHRVTFPVHALDVAADALAAVGQHDRAAGLRAEASALLLDIAARMPDDGTRTGYLGLSQHRRARERSVDDPETILR